MVDVHIIVLAEQSSPILAVHNGGTRDTRCCSHLYLKGRTTCQTELDEPFIVWPAVC